MTGRRGILARGFALVRRLRQEGGYALRRLYVRVAYPGIRLGAGVTIARGARLRAFDNGTIWIGRGTHIGEGALVEASRGHLIVGEKCHVGRGSVIVCIKAIEIGMGGLIAEYVTIRDQDHRHGDCGPPRPDEMISTPIWIGDQVWLGAKVTVTRGSRIAPRAVVGAGAVVTGHLDRSGTYAGVPARRLS